MDQNEGSLYVVICVKANCRVMFACDPFGKKNKNCWERQSQEWGLRTSIWQNKKGPWAWDISYQEIKSPHGLWGLSLRKGISFLISGLVGAFLLCLSMWQWPPSIPQLSVFQAPQGWSWDHSSPLLMVVERRRISKIHCPCLPGWERGLASPEGPGHTNEADLSFYVSKALFHRVLDCVAVFSLVTPISRYNGQECLKFSPGVGAWCFAPSG